MKSESFVERKARNVARAYNRFQSVWSSDRHWSRDERGPLIYCSLYGVWRYLLIRLFEYNIIIEKSFEIVSAEWRSRRRRRHRTAAHSRTDIYASCSKRLLTMINTRDDTGTHLAVRLRKGKKKKNDARTESETAAVVRIRRRRRRNTYIHVYTMYIYIYINVSISICMYTVLSTTVRAPWPVNDFRIRQMNCRKITSDVHNILIAMRCWKYYFVSPHRSPRSWPTHTLRRRPYRCARWYESQCSATATVVIFPRAQGRGIRRRTGAFGSEKVCRKLWVVYGPNKN